MFLLLCSWLEGRVGEDGGFMGEGVGRWGHQVPKGDTVVVVAVCFEGTSGNWLGQACQTCAHNTRHSSDE